MLSIIGLGLGSGLGLGLDTILVQTRAPAYDPKISLSSLLYSLSLNSYIIRFFM